MAKPRRLYRCQQCAHQSPKWLGKCPQCETWDTFVEESIIEPTKKLVGKTFAPAGSGLHVERHPVSLSKVRSERTKRIPTQISELDRVLGGGIVPGSLILIGGDPGIGKSTLVLQAFQALSENDVSVLYVSGEESIHQTKMRAERIGACGESLYLLSETILEQVITAVEKLKPRVLAIDSVQTLFSSEVESIPGSVSQIREVVSRIMYLAKREGISAFVIGHVTKEGTLAGPRVLEHLVDTVLYFEGDRGDQYRILRAVKNRFGSTNEIGVFEMDEVGLRGVDNPSELFLSERVINTPGSAVVSAVEGTRPMLVELQALVTPTTLALPRRTTMGIDQNRVSLLVAVLEKRGDLALYNHDIYVNVVGGLKTREPAVDVGTISAIASSFLDKPLEPQTLFLGEVGLTGEIRAVHHAETRIQEADRLGFQRCILPTSNLKKLKKKNSMELSGVSTVEELLKTLF